MKKFFIVSVLFGLLSVGVFAQVTLGGALYTGVALTVPDGGDESFEVRNREKGDSTIELAAVAARDNFGAKLDTTFIYHGSADYTFALNGIYGWVNLLDNQFRLSIGDISDAVWVTNLDNEYKFDDVSGVRVEYKTPLSGLNVGVAFDARGPATNTGSYTAEEFFKQTIFGASYIHALFNAVAAYDLGSNARGLLGFNFTGIDALTTAGIELQASDLALWDKTGILALDEEVGYRVISPLIVSLHLGQKLYGNGNDPALAFIPGVSYKILPVLTASLDIELYSDDMFTTTNLKLTPCLEYSLTGSGLLYLEYVLDLPDFKNPTHTLGFGLEIKSF
jgi:hypothetical protein